MSQIITQNQTALSTTDQVLSLIGELVRDDKVDAAKMTGIYDLQERVLARQAEAEFNMAFAELQADLPRIKKSGKVEYPKDKTKPDGPKEKAFNFARYEDIDEIIRPIMMRHGFSMSFDSGMRDGGGVTVTGRLLHRGGHARSSTVPLAVDASGGKNNLQGIGSSISYGKRYAVVMLLNLVFEGEDDDGVRGGTVFIDDAQLQQVQQLAEEVSADPEAFCRFMGVTAYPDIQKKDFAKAINALMAKKSKGGQNAKNS